MTLSPQPTDNYVYDGNAEADLAEFLRFTGDHDGSSEGWGLYVEEEDEPAGPTKPFPVLEPRTIKIPALIVGKDSYGSNGKKFRYGPPPRYLPPMETGLLPGARVPWTLSPSDQAVSGPCLSSPLHPASAFMFCVLCVLCVLCSVCVQAGQGLDRASQLPNACPIFPIYECSCCTDVNHDSAVHL